MPFDPFEPIWKDFDPFDFFFGGSNRRAEEERKHKEEEKKLERLRMKQEREDRRRRIRREIKRQKLLKRNKKLSDDTQKKVADRFHGIDGPQKEPVPMLRRGLDLPVDEKKKDGQQELTGPLPRLRRL